MYNYAAFVCLACEHEFADRLPPLCEKTPLCPLCESASKLHRVLCDRVIAWAPAWGEWLYQW